MTKVFKNLLLAVVLVLSLSLFTACSLFGETDYSSCDYWFDYKKECVEYNEDQTNFDETGTFWTLKLKRDIKGTIYLRDTADMFSKTVFELDGVAIKPEQGVDLYDFSYTVDAKKGQTIKISVVYINSAAPQMKHTIQLFGIKLDGETTILSVNLDSDFKPEVVPLAV